MSREVLAEAAGTAARARPATADRSDPGGWTGGAGPAGDAADSSSPWPRGARALLPAGRRATALIGCACLLVGAVCGWLGWRGWADQRRADAASRVGRAYAVAVGPAAVSVESGRTRVMWTIELINPGEGRVRVRAPFPGQVDMAAIGFLQARPRQAVLPAAGRVQMRVETVVPCADSAPLSAPELLMASGDGQESSLPVTGALSVVVDACAQQPSTTRSLGATHVTTSGGDLVVTLESPTARAWRVVGVEAGGVRLTATATPLTVGGQGAQLVLTAPAGHRCPVTWQAGGFPQAIDVAVEAPEPVRIPVQVGLPLSRWLLQSLCSGPQSRGGAP